MLSFSVAIAGFPARGVWHSWRSECPAVSSGSRTVPTRTRKRPHPRHVMTQDNPDALQLQFINVPSISDMLTPGQIRQMTMDYGTFNDILVSGSTLFGLVYTREWTDITTSHPRGSLVSIQSVKRVQPRLSNDKQPLVRSGGMQFPVIVAEVRCTGRTDITEVAEFSRDTAPTPWTMMRGAARLIHDDWVRNIVDRRLISECEWDAWTLCQEVSRLSRRLGKSESDQPEETPIDQEIRVWAPREYDRSISEEEWQLTPVNIQHLWQTRAEALSFAILRLSDVDEACMRAAIQMTDTHKRLQLGMEQLATKKALCLAKLSIDGALGE